MTRELSDRELKALFDELRQIQEASAPPFAPPAAGGSRRSQGRRLAIWRLAAAVLIVASALLFIVRGLPRRPRPNAPTIAQWTAPTDFLLRTPGREILESVSYDAVAPVTQKK